MTVTDLIAVLSQCPDPQAEVQVRVRKYSSDCQLQVIAGVDDAFEERDGTVRIEAMCARSSSRNAESAS